MTTPKCMRLASAPRPVGSSGMYARARPVYARAGMDNHDLAEIWAYHDGTKHSVESVYRSGHRLEWAIMPRPFKVYPDLEPIPLPKDFTSSTRPALAPLPDLEAGVYHFGPHDFALRRLRAGDHRAAVVAATASEAAIAAAPVIVACTSTFWRNAWKYQARTYRDRKS